MTVLIGILTNQIKICGAIYLRSLRTFLLATLGLTTYISPGDHKPGSYLYITPKRFTLDWDWVIFFISYFCLLEKCSGRGRWQAVEKKAKLV